MKRTDHVYIQYLIMEYKRILEKYSHSVKNSLEKVEASATMKADGGSGSGNFNHAGRPGKVGGAAPTVSAEGENVPCTGFTSKERLNSHIRKHGSEFGSISTKEYEQKGIDFLKQACNGDIIGYKTLDGKVVRFNSKTTEYATGYPGDRLCTYMKAKWTKMPNPQKAMKYYLRHKAEDLGEENAL